MLNTHSDYQFELTLYGNVTECYNVDHVWKFCRHFIGEINFDEVSFCQHISHRGLMHKAQDVELVREYSALG